MNETKIVKITNYIYKGDLIDLKTYENFLHIKASLQKQKNFLESAEFQTKYKNLTPSDKSYYSIIPQKIEHIGIVQNINSLKMYSLCTSKSNFYLKNDKVFKEIPNYKCKKGIISYLNYPIIATNEDFYKYNKVDYKIKNFPLFIKNKLIGEEEQIQFVKTTLSEFAECYFESTKLNYIIFSDFNSKISFSTIDDKIFISSYLGILNYYNSSLFNKFKQLREEDIKNLVLTNIKFRNLDQVIQKNEFENYNSIEIQGEEVSKIIINVIENWF